MTTVDVSVEGMFPEGKSVKGLIKRAENMLDQARAKTKETSA